MSFKGSPLDLNNIPEEFNSTENDSSSSTGQKKKRNEINEGKDESGKVYECRFCSLKFYKSQSLGGHMNRHRQERETETLNRARQLVFSTDNLAVHHQLGGQPTSHATIYNETPNMGDPNLYRPLYPTPTPTSTPRLFSNTTFTHLPPTQSPSPPPHQLFLYSSPPPSRLIPYTSRYPPSHDYLVGHVLTGNCDFPRARPPHDTIHYTCIGAPVGQDFPVVSGDRHTDMEVSSGGRGNTNFQDGL